MIPNSLQKDQKAFSKALKNQPVINRPRPLVVHPSQRPPSPVQSAASSSASTSGTASVSGRSTNFYIHSAIKILRDAKEPLAMADLSEKMGLSLSANPEVLERICMNERIAYDNGRLCYKPAFNIKSRDDLLALLESRKGGEAIIQNELKEMWPECAKAIDELAKEKKILVIQAKDEMQRSLFINDLAIDTHVDEAFKVAWSAQKLPNEQELLQDLLGAGLLTTNVAGKPLDPNQAQSTQKRPVKRPINRRIRITNTHVPDLVADVVSGAAPRKLP